MRLQHTLTARPRLPTALARLYDLAYNLWWTWTPAARELYVRLDPRAWRTSASNPVRLLDALPWSVLDAAAHDPAYVTAVRAVLDAFDTYMASGGWFAEHHPGATLRVGYFSAEYALADALAIYSGGLGVLAGDHLKSASDLGVPLVGVGLAYAEGYHRQQLDESGWQHERYPPNDFAELPVEPVLGPDARRLVVPIELPDRAVRAHVWCARVGRVKLYLLDTNVAANTPDDRRITARLYGGDVDTRVRQEVVLGLGGVRTLAAVGELPNVFHLNEGHSAFLSVERLRTLLRAGAPWREALAVCRAGGVFTTHTPVPAGNDEFDAAQVEWYLRVLAEDSGVGTAPFLALGRAPTGDRRFGMSVLAMRTCARRNGVSAAHGAVARALWRGLWPALPVVHDVPIGAVTNGVHAQTWVAPAMAGLLESAAGPGWRTSPDGTAWTAAAAIPDADLWRVRGELRAQLVTALGERAAGGAGVTALDPEALTVVFARRFATYKRAALVLRDVARLAKILGDPARPVQLVVAGKAHPMDEPAKRMLQQVYAATRDPRLASRLVFVPDYDLALAAVLTAGADVWLNTPRPPLEASGTSGMKAGMNGGVHLSVLDGWWCEGYSPDAGWAVGQRGPTDATTPDADPEAEDARDAADLYDLLEQRVVPLFYDRAADGVSHGWCAVMKRSIARVGGGFNSHRMVRDYVTRCYLPAATEVDRLCADDLAGARELARWQAQMEKSFAHVRVQSVRASPAEGVGAGAGVEIDAEVCLGALEPTAVRVDVYLGRVDATDDVAYVRGVVMEPTRLVLAAEVAHYRATVQLPTSGRYRYGIRVVPRYAASEDAVDQALVSWG